MVRGCEKPQILFVFDMIGSTRKLFYPLSKYLAEVVHPGDSLCFLSMEQEAAKRRFRASSPSMSAKSGSLSADCHTRHSCWRFM